MSSPPFPAAVSFSASFARRPRRLLILWLVGSVAFLLLGVLIAPLFPRAPRLGDGAVQMSRDFETTRLQTPESIVRCFWKDDTTLLTAVAKGGKLVLFRHDTRTGKTDKLPLPPALARRKLMRRSGLFFSPDGAYLLWLERGVGAPPPTAYRLFSPSTQDGTASQNSKIASQPPIVVRAARYVRRPIWLDGHRWAQIDFGIGGQQVNIFDLRDPTKRAQLPIRGATDLRDLFSATSGDGEAFLYAYGEEPAKATSKGKSAQKTRTRIVRLDIGDGKTAIAQPDVRRLPEGQSANSWFLPFNVSRSGRRVLWMEIEGYTPSVGLQKVWETMDEQFGLRNLMRLGEERGTARFWTTDANGDGARLIGKEPRNRRQSSASASRIIWTPNERGLSYLLGGALWRRSVP